MKFLVGWRNPDFSIRKEGSCYIEAESNYDAVKQFLDVRTPGTKLEGVSIKYLRNLVSFKAVNDKRKGKELPKDFDLNEYLRDLEKLEIDKTIFQ